MHPENKIKGYTLSGILENVSSFILCSISLPDGARRKGVGVSCFKCGDQKVFSHFFGAFVNVVKTMINDLKKIVTLSLKATFCWWSSNERLTHPRVQLSVVGAR